MSTISTTISATPASGLFGKVFTWLGKAWQDRHARAAFAGMSERELQDIGWGQPDRYPHDLGLPESPPDGRARATAVAAWYGKKAA